MRKNILFISRKYPPSIGGMQTYTKNLISSLKKYYDIEPVLLSGGQVHLLWFLPYALIRSFYICLRKKYDVIYVADALLAPLGLILKKVFKSKVVVTVHGLDITYANPVYQKLIPGAVSSCDKVICVSHNTMEECRKRGVPPSICSFIPNGINPDEYYLDAPRTESIAKLESVMGMKLKDKKILFTSGRLVKRKGVDWFIKNVFPSMDNDYVYIVCGKGPLKRVIADIIERAGLKERVILLGELDKEILRLLYNCASVFVMPNQKIEGDAEGFGIVAIEAASCGTPVIANSVDGIGDAVLEGKTGWLISYNDVPAFLEKIYDLRLDGNVVRRESMFFSWENLSEKYREAIERLPM